MGLPLLIRRLIGRHLVVLRTLNDPAVEGDWTLGASVTPAVEGSLVMSTAPVKHVDIRTILNAPRIASVSVSPDGKYAAVSLGEYRDGKNRETWLELRRVKDGGLERLD